LPFTVHRSPFTVHRSPFTEKTGPVRAEGKVIHPGRQVATSEGRLYGPDGKLYAHGTTTCVIFQI
jgi:acyl-coenzyme A thioesterase PaaI-like protein